MNKRRLKELEHQTQDYATVEPKFELPDQPLPLYSSPLDAPSEIAEGSISEMGGTEQGGALIAELPGQGVEKPLEHEKDAPVVGNS